MRLSGAQRWLRVHLMDNDTRAVGGFRWIHMAECPIELPERRHGFLQYTGVRADNVMVSHFRASRRGAHGCRGKASAPNDMAALIPMATNSTSKEPPINQ